MSRVPDRPVPRLGAPVPLPRARRRLEELRLAHDELTRLELEAARARRKMYRLIHECYTLDRLGPADIRPFAGGISRQRVLQIVAEVEARDNNKRNGG